MNFNHYTMKKQLAFFLCLGFLMTANVMFAQPANDDCGGAIALTLAPDAASAVPVTATTVGATASGSTTGSPASVCSGSWYFDDVWFTFTTGATAPGAGITVEAVAIDTFVPVGVAIYASCDTAALPIVCESQGADDFVSFPFVSLQPNTTYQLRIWSGGASFNSGAFDIVVYENPFNPNAPADVVLWGNNPGEGQFDGSLNGWTSVVGATSTNTTDDWIWDANATSNWIGNSIVSPTANNGAALFDAAFMTLDVDPNPAGPPYPGHTAELLSPIIDCSMMPEMAVKFYQAYHALNGDCLFSYSVDGGQTFTTPINVNSTIAANTRAPSPSIKRYDLPGASGSSQVQLKFTADMDFYDWLIDDVQLVEKAANDIALANGFIAIAPKYSMPQTSIDTIYFLSDVANIGVNDAINVELTVDIVRNSDNVSVFTATNAYGTIPAGDTVENQIFTDFFVPDTAIASYTATYTLSSDSSDLVPGNNTYSFEFEVVEDYFDRIASPADDVGLAGSYSYGVTHRVQGGTVIDGNNNLDTLYREVTSVTMGISNADELGGQSVSISIEKPAVGNRFTYNATTGEIAIVDREVLALANYTFTGTEPADFILDLPMEDFFSPGDLVALEADMHYIIIMRYDASPNTTLNLRMMSSAAGDYPYGATEFAIEQQTGQDLFSLVSDADNDGVYVAGGAIVANTNAVPTQAFVPYLRMNFIERFETSTNNTKLDENVLTVFPNPADEFVTATLDLEEMTTNATFTIYNVTGQVMETRSLGNVTNEQVRFNLSNYTSGTYYMSVDTDAGRSIKRFVVAK